MPHHRPHRIRQILVEWNFGPFILNLRNHAHLLVVELALKGALFGLDPAEGLSFDAAYLSLQRVEPRKLIDALPLQSLKSRNSPGYRRVYFFLQSLKDATERFALFIDYVGGAIVKPLESLVGLSVELPELLVNELL